MSVLQSPVTSNQTLINETSKKLDEIFENDVPIKKYNKNDVFQEYIKVMIELFQMKV